MSKPHSQLPRRPLAWITLALAGGILLAGTVGENSNAALWTFLLMSLACGAVAAISRRTVWFTITLLSLAASLGFLRLRAQSIISNNDVSRYAPGVVWLEGTVDSDVEETYSGFGNQPG